MRVLISPKARLIVPEETLRGILEYCFQWTTEDWKRKHKAEGKQGELSWQVTVRQR